MRVKDVMTVDVVTTAAETPLKEAAELLGVDAISGVPVVAADGSVLGVVSEADILAKERPHVSEAQGALARRLRPRTPADEGKHEAHFVARR